MSGRTTLTAPEAARSAVAERVALVPGKVTVEVPRPAWTKDGRLRLTARSLKVTVVVDPAVLAGIEVPTGKPHVPIVIDVAGRKVTGQFTAKSLRKAVAAVAEHGAEGVAVVVQAKLAAGDKLEDTGVLAQPKGPRP
jgi:hypothetical protein